MDAERYAFRLEFFNELSAINDVFQLLYYVRRDGKDEIELMDPKRKRRFLSRVHYPGLKLADIVIGGKITMCVAAAAVGQLGGGKMSTSSPARMLVVLSVVQLLAPVQGRRLRGRLHPRCAQQGETEVRAVDGACSLVAQQTRRN